MNHDHLELPFFAEARPDGRRHDDFARALAAWTTEHGPALLAEEHAAGHDDTRLDALMQRLVKSLGRAGILAAAAPVHGTEGAGLRPDVRTLCLVREHLAFHSGLFDFAFAMQGLGTGPLLLAGTPEQRERFLPPVHAGDALAAFAISEAEAGSDPGAMTTRAVRDAGSGTYRIDGEKTWISNAGIAGHYVVFARTGPDPGPGKRSSKGISAFVVPADTPGLEVVERIPITGPHPIGTLRFSRCAVPESLRLGAEGDGFRIAMATLDTFRPTVGAAALGMARRALEATVEHAATRRLGAGVLADSLMVQERIADMHVDVELSTLAVYRAAWERDVREGRVSAPAALAKLTATEAAQRVVDAAVQLHGGRGVVFGAPMERLYREVRALRIYEGATEVQKLILAGHVLARRRDRAAQTPAPPQPAEEDR